MRLRRRHLTIPRGHPGSEPIWAKDLMLVLRRVIIDLRRKVVLRPVSFYLAISRYVAKEFWFRCLLAAAFGYCHFRYSAMVGFALWQLSGGIVHEGNCTTYGVKDWAWTDVAWLPGPIAGCCGMALMPVGSLVAGWLLASLLFPHGPVGFGSFRTRAWLAVLFWLVWFPVPSKLSATYWWTVAY